MPRDPWPSNDNPHGPRNVRPALAKAPAYLYYFTWRSPIRQGKMKAYHTLEIPFVFSSNGDGFVFHDKTSASGAPETTLALDAFPSPTDLWERYRAWKGLTPEAELVKLLDKALA